MVLCFIKGLFRTVLSRFHLYVCIYEGFLQFKAETTFKGTIA